MNYELNENQRNFKVERIEKYRKEIDGEWGNELIGIVFLGAGISDVFLGAISYGARLDGHLFNVGPYITSAFVIGGGMSSAYGIKKLMSAVLKKAGLENRINKIEEQLQLDELSQKENISETDEISNSKVKTR
jgi:hypothetical protein